MIDKDSLYSWFLVDWEQEDSEDMKKFFTINLSVIMEDYNDFNNGIDRRRKMVAVKYTGITVIKPFKF